MYSVLIYRTPETPLYMFLEECLRRDQPAKINGVRNVCFTLDKIQVESSAIVKANEREN